MVIFRVGLAAVRVGQRLLPLALLLAACPAPAAALAAPDLAIPRLDHDAGASPSRSGEGARFGHPPPVVGSTWTVETQASSRSTDPGGASEQVSRYESTYRVEVLAVDGPAPSRVKLVVTRNVQTYQEQPTPTVIDGKAYLVDARSPHVRDLANLPVPIAESERVLDMLSDLGTRSRIDQMLPDEALAIGAHRDDLAGAILRLVHPRAWTLRSGTCTLVRVEGGHAVFATELDAASDSGLSLEVHGEARVRLEDARLVALTLAGRYTSADPADPPGTFELRRTVTSESVAPLRATAR